MTLPLATTDADAWVEILGGPTTAHQGKRLRLVRHDFTHEGRVEEVGPELTYFSGGNVYYETDSGLWFVHPDDVPDPDADLISNIAADLLRAWMETTSWGSPPGVPDPVWENLARVAIERVRGAA